MKVILVILTFLTANTWGQTWQYSIGDDYQLGVRDKIGDNDQKVKLTLVSEDEKYVLVTELMVNSDEWKYADFPNDFAEKAIEFPKDELILFNWSLDMGEHNLFETKVYYCAAVLDENMPIRKDKVPQMILDKLKGEFVECSMYKNDNGINYHIGQRVTVNESTYIVEHLYTVTPNGFIKEMKIER